MATAWRTQPTDQAIASYSPPIGLADLLLGMALGAGLSAALWWTGHPTAAVAILLLTAAAASLASCLPLERCSIGHGWIANERTRRTVVVRGDAISAIRLPATMSGLWYLVVVAEDALAVVDLNVLFKRADLARAAIDVLQPAIERGVDVEPEVHAVLDSLRRRHRDAA